MTVTEWIYDLEDLWNAYLETGDAWFLNLWHETEMYGPYAFIRAESQYV